MRVVEHCDPKWIGIQYDPGHCALSGELPRCALNLMGPYCQSVNFKGPRYLNYINPTTGQLNYRFMIGPLRDGMLNVPLVLAELQKAGYTDPISIHAEYGAYFYEVTKNLEATNKLVAADVQYVRECMSKMQ